MEHLDGPSHPVRVVKIGSKSRTVRGDFAALRPIDLPSPAFRGSGSLSQALRLRRTVREIGEKPVAAQTLSNLLFAACGVNRRKGPFGLPGRTAPSASNSQEIDVYVALARAAYRYDPFRHRLVPAAAGDLRPLAIGRGQARSGDQAPVRLVYVADVGKLVHSKGFQEPGLHDARVQRSYYYVDTGLIAANVYLFAASTGLAAWFHNCNKSVLHKKLRLGGEQRVLFGQTVGYASKTPRRGARVTGAAPSGRRAIR
jgi:hypothetical protein